MEPLKSWLKEVEGFDWDEGNSKKSIDKHGVANTNCEQVFTNQPLVVETDLNHSGNETRFRALGKDNHGMRLFVAFTFRKNHIRVISARVMSRQERRVYEEVEKTSKI